MVSCHILHHQNESTNSIHHPRCGGKLAAAARCAMMGAPFFEVIVCSGSAATFPPLAGISPWQSAPRRWAPTRLRSSRAIPAAAAQSPLRRRTLPPSTPNAPGAGIDRLVAHAPYTLNPCAAKPQVAEFARMAFSDDLRRMEHTPGQFYNFHPGQPRRSGYRRGHREDRRTAQ